MCRAQTNFANIVRWELFRNPFEKFQCYSLLFIEATGHGILHSFKLLDFFNMFVKIPTWFSLVFMLATSMHASPLFTKSRATNETNAAVQSPLISLQIKPYKCSSKSIFRDRKFHTKLCRKFWKSPTKIVSVWSLASKISRGGVENSTLQNQKTLLPDKSKHVDERNKSCRLKWKVVKRVLANCNIRGKSGGPDAFPLGSFKSVALLAFFLDDVSDFSKKLWQKGSEAKDSWKKLTNVE